MKKRIFLLVAMIIATLNLSYAQNDIFHKGTKAANIGLSLGAYGSNTTTFLPINASFDIGIVDDVFTDGITLSLGGYANYYGYDNSYFSLGEKYGIKGSSILLGARGALHYQFVDKLDTYAGLMLGYQIVSSSEYGKYIGNYTHSGSAVGYGLYVGARYFFTENIGAFAELGYGVAALDLGVTFKF